MCIIKWKEEWKEEGKEGGRVCLTRPGASLVSHTHRAHSLRCPWSAPQQIVIDLLFFFHAYIYFYFFGTGVQIKSRRNIDGIVGIGKRLTEFKKSEPRISRGRGAVRP